MKRIATLAGLAGLLLAACSTPAEPTSAAQPSAIKSKGGEAAPQEGAQDQKPAPAGPTVQQIADRLEELYPLPNRRDNSGKWADIGVVGLITTDAVSIYQWRTEALAKKWANGSQDIIRIGVYTLSFRGSEQQLTSQKARRRMAAEVRKMVGD